MERPRTRYAKSGDVSIAYQVSGEGGPVDLVFAPGTVSHLDIDWDWDDPEDLWFLGRLHSFCRLIRFDKRGTGLSDRVKHVASLEERIDDIRAVMDAAGSESAVIFGGSEGGSMACLFAATYPERTRSLIVWGGQATWIEGPDAPWGIPREKYEAVIEELAVHGVTEEYVRGWGAGMGEAASQEDVDREIRAFQAGASPGAVADLERMNMQIDITFDSSSIRVPTLVINATGDPVSPIEGARDLAKRIPAARLVEYPGASHMPANREQTSIILDAIEEFMTGTQPTPHPDRVLVTVVFIDIVGSTEKAVELGDSKWKAFLGEFQRLVREELIHFRGREIDTAGDGFFATFDGPARAVRCALAITEGVRSLGVEIRAGCHTGEVELDQAGVRGVAVVIGARIGALAGPSEVICSSTVRDVTTGSGLLFEDRGVRFLKGIPEEWHLYAVTPNKSIGNVD